MNGPSSELARASGARAGSPDDFSRLVAAHQCGLRAFLRRLCGNHALADDIAQETFVFAWKAMARFDTERDFRPWLFGIGWRKYHEQKRAWFRLARREQVAAATGERFTPNLGLHLDLAAALRTLSPEQRAAVLLCLACEFTHAEAAEALAIPLGTVKSHVARARERLQAALGESHD